MSHVGPMGCVIEEDYTLESDDRISRATGQPIFFGDDKVNAEYNGRWEFLQSRGVKGVFLFERYEKVRPLVPHFQRQGTCVARGFHMATQHSLFNAISSGVQQGDFSQEIAWEPFYIGSRVYVGKSRISGDGSVGSWAAEWASGANGQGGICPRGHYSKIDLTLTNEKWACDNANRGGGMPADMMAACQKHTCSVHRVRNNTEIADAIASRFGVARCWDTLFGNRDNNGFSRPSSKGAHCQAVVGVFVMKNGKTGFIELQSWGEQPKGNRTLRYAGGELLLPIGCYAVSADDYLVAQRSKWWEAHAMSVRVGQEFR